MTINSLSLAGSMAKYFAPAVITAIATFTPIVSNAQIPIPNPPVSGQTKEHCIANASAKLNQNIKQHGSQNKRTTNARKQWVRAVQPCRALPSAGGSR